MNREGGKKIGCAFSCIFLFLLSANRSFLSAAYPSPGFPSKFPAEPEKVLKFQVETFLRNALTKEELEKAKADFYQLLLRK